MIVPENVKLKRAYEPAIPGDGVRILVDRLWPRGVSKKDAALSFWMKDIAPSSDLREWFNHDPEKWIEFRRRYSQEINSNNPTLLAQLRSLASKGPITLIYSARDNEHNDAIVLREAILEAGK